MPKWSQYLEDDDMDNDLPAPSFQKIKKKSDYHEDTGRTGKKKPKPHQTDSTFPV